MEARKPVDLVVGFDGFDLASPRSHLLLPPHLTREQTENFRARLPELEAHVWILTSGSGGAPKLVALAKSALLASAEGVLGALARLGVGSVETWLLTLPLYHVGGLGIYVRARRAGHRVAMLPLKGGRPVWEAAAFVAQVEKGGVTLTSLVPTQVFDLVEAKLAAPASLKAVFVGGGALDEDLAARARTLGWPLVASYGMTETASMVAASDPPAAPPSAYGYALLPHVEARRSEDGHLEFRSKSLLSGFVRGEAFADGEGTTVPLEKPFTADGFFRTEDLGRVERGADGRVRLFVEGRGADFLKIQGENVSIPGVERTLRARAKEAGLDPERIAVLWRAEARRGADLVLALRGADSEAAYRSVFEAHNAAAPSFERFASLETVDVFPTVELGKLRRRLS